MSDPLATFDSLLQEVTKRKPPISASTVESLTKSACKVKPEEAARVVTKVENFFVAAPRTYRLSGLYLIDAICKSKASAQNDFPKLFANRLGAHMAMLLDGASEKEQESAKKLARIWVEKSVFPAPALSQVALVLHQTLKHTVPGSESLPPPPAMNSMPPPSLSTSGVYPFQPTMLASEQPPLPPTSNIFPGVPPLQPFPGMPPSALPPGPMPPYQPPAASSLVDQLSSLGDLNALLGPTSSAPMPSLLPGGPSNLQRPMDPRYGQIDSPYPPSNGNYGVDNRFAGDQRYSPGPGQYGAGPMGRGPQRPGEERYNAPNDPYAPHAQHSPHASYQPRDGFGPRDPRDSSTPYQPREGFGPMPTMQQQQQRGGQQQNMPPDPNVPIYSSSLFIGSLPANASEADLREIFAVHGAIKRVTLKADKNIAFIAYHKRPDAEAAKNALDNTSLGGRTIHIRWAKSDQYYHGTVDPETGLMSFDNAAPSDGGNARQMPPQHQHGIPRGVRPQVGSSFADDVDVPYNNGGARSTDGKRRYEGQQPEADKRRFVEQDSGFESISTWSGK